MRKVLLGVLAALAVSPVPAAVVINPFAPIPAGLTAKIAHFTTLPPTSSTQPRTGAQGLKGLNDGSGRPFINDTRGILYVTNSGGSTPTPYLDLRGKFGFSNAADGTQTGLMSFAFHPNFNKDPNKPGYKTFYTIDTTAPTGGAAWGVPGAPVNHEDVVREWTVANPAAPTANVTAMREVTRFAQPFRDHGPGTIAFNPSAGENSADYGNLYIGLGDGGGVNDPLGSAQNLNSPFGKILRINPADPDGIGPLTYGIPADNPFAAQGGARGEVWAYGLRNPQHFSWSADGRMFISEIGQAQIEEVDLGRAGGNYGWPLREGTYAHGSGSDENIYDTPLNGGLFIDPIAQYDHEEIARDGISNLASIGGAFLYEGSLLPELFGKVLMTDLASGRLFYFDPDMPAGANGAQLYELMLTLDDLPTSLRALEGYGGAKHVDLRLGVDADGEIYMLTKGGGNIYRFVAAPVPEPAMWALALLGFGAIGMTMRRQSGLARA
jgi:glucose/arabinose dehydrogenase